MAADVLACSGSANYVMYVDWPLLPEQHTVEVRYKIGNGAWVDLPAETSDTLWHLRASKSWVHWTDQLPAQATSYDVEAQVPYTKTLGSDDIVGAWGTSGTFTAGTSADVDRVLTRCPGALTGLTVSSYTSTTATVTWNAVSGSYDYDIRHKATTDTTWGPTTSLTSPSYTNHATTHTITGLDNTKTYNIAVRAREWHEAATSNWTTVTTTLPSLTVTNIAVDAAMLGLSGHGTNSWWYRQTAPNTGTCTGPVTNNRGSLSNLTAATAYTYAAYSETGCADADKMDSVTFATLARSGNLTQPSPSNSDQDIGHDGTNLREGAQAFTTGSNAGGYELHSIDASFSAKTGSPGNIVVKIHADSTTSPWAPGTALATLNGSNPTTAGNKEWTCYTSHGCDLDLEPSTTYLIVMSAPASPSGNNAYQWQTTESDDETSSSDLSIANVGKKKVGTGSWTDLPNSNSNSNSLAFKISVDTIPKPALTATSVTANTATLTLAGYASNWWLKRTSPSGGTCTAGESDYSHALSNLTGATTYTYKAYSDAACATEVNSVSFTTDTDYDTNDDGLIEISSLAQLNAIRWDTNGDGLVTGSNQSNFRSAFPGGTYTGTGAMGCPSTGCSGYELDADLDFDTNGNGTADSGDTYWDSGKGWNPIAEYATTLDGNGHTISNLFINRTSVSWAGLFARVKSGGTISNLTLYGTSVTSTNAVNHLNNSLAGAFAGRLSSGAKIRGVEAYGNVTAQASVSRPTIAGGLVGHNAGDVSDSHSNVTVNAITPADGLQIYAFAGGIAGENSGDITTSYFTASASANARHNNSSGGEARSGGIVGKLTGGSIKASYSTGTTDSRGTNNWSGGGIVGYMLIDGNNATAELVAVYATGQVKRGSQNPLLNADFNGVVGKTIARNGGSITVTDSYYDKDKIKQVTAKTYNVEKTTAELQSPTGYSGIYANWDLNLDGVTGGDDPWHFGTSSEYPVLKDAPVALLAPDVKANTAIIRIVNHNGGWWYKGDQAGANCTSVAAGTKNITLSSLTEDTTYTYTAYSNSACTTELATRTFPTLSS